MTVEADFPFPLAPPDPVIRTLADSHRKLVDSLRSIDAGRALSRTAGLLTVPEWQSSTVRLEVLQHFIAAFASGTRKPKTADFKRWLSELGDGLVGALEDPAEDIFVSRVLIPGHDCLIFEGVYESAAFHVQRFVNILDEMPDTGNYQLMKRAAYSLLKLSNEVVRRSGIEPFAVGGESPLRHVSDSSIGNPVKRSERVRFSMDQLQSLGIDPEDLSTFVFDPARRDSLVDEQIGGSTLERHPLAVLDAHIYLVLPTAVSMAIRRMIIDACSGEMRAMLYAGYKREIERAFSELPILGGSVGTPISFQRVKGIYVGNVARYVDEGRLLHVCVAIDDLTTYAASGMTKPDPDPDKLSKAVESSIAYTHERFSGQPKFREATSLVVLCPWGRPLLLEFDRPRDARWRVESISAADLETLSWESAFSPLALWRVLDARDQLTAMNVHLVNMNGLLNLHGWAESLDGHLVPHGQLPDDFNPEVGLQVMITQNALLDIRRRLSAAWNLHHAETWDGRRVKVRREAISSFFDEDRFAPTYVSMDDLASGALNAVYETQARNWWTTVETPGTQNRQFHHQLWHLTVVWLRRAAPILEGFLPTLPAGPLLWFTHFVDSDDVPADAPVPSREEARSTLRFEVRANVIHVHAGPGFILAGRNTTNIAESLLVEFLVRGAFELANAEPNEDRIAAAIAAIVPDEWARDMHLIPARGFRDYLRSHLPGKPILISQADDAASRIGLGWLHRNRSEGSKIEGIRECCSYLEAVVDSLWSQVQAELRQYDKQTLLKQLIGNHEAVIFETESWMRSARAMLSLHVDKEETALVSARRIARFNGAALSSRLLIEIALFECPNSGGRAAGRLDISRLLARALQMHTYGGWSEAIRYEGKKAELRITPLGDVFTQIDFDEKIASPYGEALGIKRFRGGARGYERNFQLPEPQKSARNVFEPEFWQAWEQHFGFSIDDARTFLDNLDDLGIEQSDFAYVATHSQLVGLSSAGLLPPETVNAIVDALALKPRPSWDFTPNGFAPRDWYPWRFRRRLSCVSRPILQLSEGDNPDYLIAPGMVRTGFAKLMDYCHRGGFEAKDFPPGPMRQWIGTTENRRGHKFNEEVRDRLRALGWQAKSNVKLTEILNAKTERDYGDVDVLAWRGDQILLIECKDLELAMTAGEIARQLYEFRGADDRKGRPDRLKKHLLRAVLLKERVADVLRFTRTPDTVSLIAMLVFSDIVPMHFSEIAAKHDVRLVTFDDLHSI